MARSLTQAVSTASEFPAALSQSRARVVAARRAPRPSRARGTRPGRTRRAGPGGWPAAWPRWPRPRRRRFESTRSVVGGRGRAGAAGAGGGAIPGAGGASRPSETSVPPSRARFLGRGGAVRPVHEAHRHAPGVVARAAPAALPADHRPSRHPDELSEPLLARAQRFLGLHEHAGGVDVDEDGHEGSCVAHQGSTERGPCHQVAHAAAKRASHGATTKGPSAREAHLCPPDAHTVRREAPPRAQGAPQARRPRTHGRRRRSIRAGKRTSRALVRQRLETRRTSRAEERHARREARIAAGAKRSSSRMERHRAPQERSMRSTNPSRSAAGGFFAWGLAPRAGSCATGPERCATRREGSHRGRRDATSPRSALAYGARLRQLAGHDSRPAHRARRRSGDARALRRRGVGRARAGDDLPVRDAPREHRGLLPHRAGVAAGDVDDAHLADPAAHAHDGLHGRAHDVLGVRLRDDRAPQGARVRGGGLLRGRHAARVLRGGARGDGGGEAVRGGVRGRRGQGRGPGRHGVS